MPGSGERLKPEMVHVEDINDETPTPTSDSNISPQLPARGQASAQHVARISKVLIDDEKPRCFDHGCAGRSFSCAENYLRHVREKNATKTIECDFCKTSFSRKSNRDSHVSRMKCKVLRNLCNDASESPKSKPVIS